MVLRGIFADGIGVDLSVHFYFNQDDTICIAHTTQCVIYEDGEGVPRVFRYKTVTPQKDKDGNQPKPYQVRTGKRINFPPCQNHSGPIGTSRCSSSDADRKSREVGMKVAFASVLDQLGYDHVLRKQLWMELFKRFPDWKQEQGGARSRRRARAEVVAA